MLVYILLLTSIYATEIATGVTLKATEDGDNLNFVLTADGTDYVGADKYFAIGFGGTTMDGLYTILCTIDGSNNSGVAEYVTVLSPRGA